MMKLVKNEFRKFSNSYIHIVSFAAMLFPVCVYRSCVFFQRRFCLYVGGIYR